MGLRVVTVPGKREMVNPMLGLGLVWWRSIPKLLPAFTHILWSTGPNCHSLSGYYVQSSMPDTGET